MFAHLLPLLGILSLVLIGVVWRGWLQWRRYGTSGIVLFQMSDWRRQLRDAIFCLLLVGEMIQAVAFAVSSSAIEPFIALRLPAAGLWAGAVLVAAGLALMVAAQLGMGVSWRIGIDHAASPGLVTSGLYQFCRNPIYLGMIASLTGLTLMLPTWFSIAMAAGVVWCIRTQTIEEEAYLERTYGESFRRYAAGIGRFVPMLGRLAAE